MLFERHLMGGHSIPVLQDIIHYYEACCTAEFILDNWTDICEDAALEIAYEVRERMRDEEVCSGEDECRIIGQVIARWKEKGYALT